MVKWSTKALNHHRAWLQELFDYDTYYGTDSMTNYINDLNEAERNIMDHPETWPFMDGSNKIRVYRALKYKALYVFNRNNDPLIVGILGL